MPRDLDSVRGASRTCGSGSRVMRGHEACNDIVARPRALSLWSSAANNCQLVGDVLGKVRQAPPCNPVNHVITWRQRSYEQVITLLATWAQDQLGYDAFIDS